MFRTLLSRSGDSVFSRIGFGVVFPPPHLISQCYTRSPLRDNGAGPGWVEGDDFTPVPGFAPRALPASPASPKPRCGGDQAAEPRGRSLLPPSQHHSGPASPVGPQARQVPSKQPGRGAIKTQESGSGPAAPARLGAAPGPRKRLRGCGAGRAASAAGPGLLRPAGITFPSTLVCS